LYILDYQSVPNLVLSRAKVNTISLCSSGASIHILLKDALWSKVCSCSSPHWATQYFFLNYKNSEIPVYLSHGAGGISHCCCSLDHR